MSPDLHAALAQFVPEARVTAVRRLGEGMIHNTYLVHSGVQGWILQCLNTKVFQTPDQVMNTLVLVQAHLKKSDYPYQLAEPLHTQEQRLLYEDPDGRVWRAFPYLTDTYAPETRPNAEEAYEAATAYGHFLSALRDFPATSLPETIPGFHDTMRRWALFEETRSTASPSRKARAARQIAQLQELLPVFNLIQNLKSENALPLRVTHNDTKAGNVLLNIHTRKAVAVIDLDTVMPGVILSDFGDMARTFVPDRPEDDPAIHQIILREEVLSALQEGFLNATGSWLTATERTQLLTGAIWITAEQALRFLTDYLAGDVYYKVQYPEHNLVRTQNQLKIVEILQKLAP